MKTINTKQIRADLVGFLRELENGQPVTILYRSKPLVTVSAVSDEGSWETVVDLEAFEPGGVAINDVLEQL